jgi:hypothetical protein
MHCIFLMRDGVRWQWEDGRHTELSRGIGHLLIGARAHKMNDKMSIFALMTDMSFSYRVLRHRTLENETIKMQKGWSN